MSSVSAIAVAASLSAGVALGIFYFYAVYQTARLHAAHAAALKVVPLYLFRAAVAVGVFLFLARQGALPLLLGLTGFVGARLVMQRILGAR